MQLTGLIVALSVLLPSVALAQGWVDRSLQNSPPSRYDHGLAYDPVRGYTILAGGVGAGSGNARLTDTWTWDGTAWTQHAAAVPASLGSPIRLQFDPLTGAVMCVTRSDASTLAIHSWDGVAWNPSGSVPVCVSAAQVGLAFDPIRNSMLLYGMSSYGGCPFLHTWDGAAWTSRPCPSVPAWNNSYPIVDRNAQLTWDPAAGRLALTTGDDYSNTFGARVYEWTGANWLQRFPAIRPIAFGATATDAVAGCVVMLDGDTVGPSSQAPGHTWTLRNGTFQQLNLPWEPMRRVKTAMAYDSARGVTVLFGGSPDGYQYHFADTWELTLGAPASYTPFGGGCPGSRGVPQLAAQGGSTPRIGTTFTAQATNLPWTGLAFLFLGLSNTSYSGTPLPANLGFLGAPACNLLCSGDEVYILPNALGSTSWSFTVPPYPGLSFYNQVLPLDPTANNLGLTLSNAARGVIGL